MTTEKKGTPKACERCIKWGKSGVPYSSPTLVVCFLLIIICVLGAVIGLTKADGMFVPSVFSGLGFFLLLVHGMFTPVHATAFRDEAGNDHLHREGPTWAIQEGTGRRWFFFEKKCDDVPLLAAKGLFVRFRISGLLSRRGRVYLPNGLPTLSMTDVGMPRWEVVGAWNWRVTLRDPNGVEFGGLDWHGMLAQMNDLGTYQEMTQKIATSGQIEKDLQFEMTRLQRLVERNVVLRDWLGTVMVAALDLMTVCRTTIGQSAHAKRLRQLIEFGFSRMGDPAAYSVAVMDDLTATWREAGAQDQLLQDLITRIRTEIANERTRRRGATPTDA